MDLGSVSFEFDATVDKAWQDKTTGKMHVRAVASDDQLDLQRDKMSTMALEKMAQMAQRGVPLLETHRHTFGFGKTTGGRVMQSQDEMGRPINQLVVEMELDGDYPQARSLFREVASGACDKQLSIGGKLNLKNRDAVTVEMTGGGLSRTINDLELDHIASTRKAQAANPRTNFVEAIAKALDPLEAAGMWSAQEVLAKAQGSSENPTIMSAPSNADDIQAGATFLATVGKMVRGGVNKNYDNPNGGETEESETTPMEPQEPEMGGHQKAKSLVDDVKTPTGEAPEQAALKPAADKPGAMAAKSGGGQALALAGEVATLLSKMGGFSFGEDDAGTTPADATTPMGEDAEKALVQTLTAARNMLAKKLEGAAAGPGDAQGKVGEEGLFAPDDESAASAGASPDKAPNNADSDVGGSGVSDSRRDIQVGGEIKSTAPGAAEAYKATKGDVARHGKLPQQGDNDLFGKSLSEGYATLEKSLVEKQLDITTTVVTAAVEKMLERQDGQNDAVMKAIDGIGGAANQAARTAAGTAALLEKALKRIDNLEKQGGISHSGPRGAGDAVAPRIEKNHNDDGPWTGLFGQAVKEATAQY